MLITNAHHAHATIELLKKENSRNHPTLTVASKFARLEFIWLFDYVIACAEICKRRCTNPASLIKIYQRCYWWMAADVIQLGLFRSQLVFPFLQMHADACNVQIHLQYFQNNVINCNQIWW